MVGLSKLKMPFSLEKLKKDFEFEKPAEVLILEALNRLSKSGDRINGLPHTLRILRNLKKLFDQSPELRKNVNEEALVVACFFHDLWKVEMQKSGFLSSIHGLIFEGKLSSELFIERAEEWGYSQELTKLVQYVIREHSSFNFYHSTLESKIFHDLDQLDSDDKERKALLNKKLRGKFLMRLLYTIQELIPKKYYLPQVVKKIKESL